MKDNDVLFIASTQVGMTGIIVALSATDIAMNSLILSFVCLFVGTVGVGASLALDLKPDLWKSGVTTDE